MKAIVLFNATNGTVAAVGVANADALTDEEVEDLQRRGDVAGFKVYITTAHSLNEVWDYIDEELEALSLVEKEG